MSSADTICSNQLLQTTHSPGVLNPAPCLQMDDEHPED